MEETWHRGEWWWIVQHYVFKEDMKSTKSIKEKSSTPQAQEFTSVAEIRAVSQQLLLAPGPWNNIIREVLLGIYVTLGFLPYPSFAQALRTAELLGSCTACFVFTILPSDPFTNKAFSKHVFKQCLSFCWSLWLGSWRVRVGTIPFWAVALQNRSGHRQSCLCTRAPTQAWVLCFELGLKKDT